MRGLLYLVGMGMAAWLDFATGAALTVCLAGIFEMPIGWQHFVVGGLLGFLPDLFDQLPPIIVTAITGRGAPKKEYDRHQTFFHRPLYFLCVATLAALAIDLIFFGHLFWAVATFICVAYHYWHDTDYGIAIWWPIEKRYWVRGKGFLTPEEASEADGIGTNLYRWLDERWLREHRYSRGEVTVGAINLALAIGIVLGVWYGIAFFVVPILGMYFVWWIAEKYQDSKGKILPWT